MGKSIKTISGSFIPKGLLRGGFLLSLGLLSFSNMAVAEGNLWNRISTHPLHAVQSTVKGRVLDANTKEPIAGATVKVVGKSTATSTDDAGNFEISASANDVLEVSYIGYLKASSVVTSVSQNITIEMGFDKTTFEEVVVTGYGAQRKKDLTGSVAVVNVSQLKSQPAATAVEALQGRATGVQIVNDGAPGSTPQIRIRGYSTINNNEPLYVIDGVPYEGKLSWFNQNDIETMQVLKDASAASIYGARANNGV